MGEDDVKPRGEDEFKPEAKCKYHHCCALYNLDALSPELEIKMCGRGQPVEKNYEPQIPLPSEFKPANGFYHGPNEETCTAFMRFKDLDLIIAIRDHLGIQKELFEKHGYW